LNTGPSASLALVELEAAAYFREPGQERESLPPFDMHNLPGAQEIPAGFGGGHEN
jgi:hypothetical protein